MRQRVTIEDIARETELSRGTVSRAINDRPDISVATKQRVLAACKKLRYAPSHAARSLATGRSFSLIAFVRDLRDPHAAAILSGAIRRAEASGYLVHPIELSDSSDESAAAIERFVNERTDGVLLAAAIADSTRAQLTEAMGEKPLVHTIEAGPQSDFVAPDWREAGRAAARYSVQQGLRRTLLIDTGTRASAREGFLEAAAEEHLHVKSVDAPASTAAVRSLGEHLDSIDGVVTLGMPAARTAAVSAAAAGYWPGERISILSIGDGPCASHIRPTISAIDVDPVEIGRRATDLILARLGEGAERSVVADFVPPVLRERESTSGPKSGRPRHRGS